MNPDGVIFDVVNNTIFFINLFLNIYQNEH